MCQTYYMLNKINQENKKCPESCDCNCINCAMSYHDRCEKHE